MRQLKDRGLPADEEGMGKYCMVNVDPVFPAKVRKGEFIVAGQNFGCGNNFYRGCVALKGGGIEAVICESANTNLVRNAVNHAVPCVWKLRAPKEPRP